MPQLASEWKTVLKKAWSMRFMALAMVFTVAEAVLPMFSEMIPRSLFESLTAISIAGGMASRLISQKDFK